MQPTMPSDPHVFDELKVPFIFVPHGAPEPTAWLANHRDFIKLPATFVPRGRGGDQANLSSDGPPLIQHRTVDGLAAASGPTAPRPSNGSAMSDPMSAATNQTPAPASSPGDPIAAYLRANEALAPVEEPRQQPAFRVLLLPRPTMG
jgi:hypothetical protein